MSLANVATEVHEFLQTATNKEHFLDLIDWVEEKTAATTDIKGICW